MTERKQIENATEILQKIANGINPVNGESISDESFLNDPQIIRSFYYILQILEGVLSGVFTKKITGKFNINDEQLKAVVLPEGKLGISEFLKCINNVLDISNKKITATELNKKLKQMKILSEQKDTDGKAITVINDNSYRYGFEIEHRSFNGREYDKILVNAKGKEYLLENLVKIMSVSA